MSGANGTEGMADQEPGAGDQMGEGNPSEEIEGEASAAGSAEALDELNVPPPLSEDLPAGGTATAEPDEIEKLRAEARENYDKYLRAAAELENVKKRAIKERSDILKYAGENLARDVVDVLDDLERALSAETKGNLEDFLKGVALIRDRFTSILEQHSIRPQSALGKDFDPLEQQALASVPTDDHPPGMVIQEFKKAYHFKDKLLRPGQVVVSAAKPDKVD